MGQMTVRNIPDNDYEALKRVAAQNNRSAEAEVRLAIAQLVRIETGTGFGTKLNAKYGGVIDDGFQFDRDKTAGEPMVFE